MDIDKGNLYIGTHKMQDAQWQGPCQKSKPKSATLMGNASKGKQSFSSQNMPFGILIILSWSFSREKKNQEKP